MARSLQKLLAASFCVLLAACGGGGGGDDDNSGTPTQNETSNGNNTGSSGGSGAPTDGTSNPPSGDGSSTPPSSGSDSSSGGNSGSPTNPTFSAQLVSAPPEIPPAIDTEPMEFIVSGSNLGNVELVSAKDETIVYGRFTISSDKTRATLPWSHDTRYNDKVYDTYQFRILAWDVPLGESGNRIEVMPSRTYRGIYSSGCQPCGGEAP
ncbi:MAG: hypothetical protein ACO1NO_11920 [Burkholderiaceae bacterium]